MTATAPSSKKRPDRYASGWEEHPAAGPLAARLAPVTCACQYGPTHHCLRGAHDRCTAGTARVSPEAYLTDRYGLVALAPFSVQVWRSGRPCRYRCPCPCHDTGQLALFDPEDIR